MSRHPSVVTWVDGHVRVQPCDCGWCERREPLIGAALVLLVAAMAASFLLWVIG
jgi:prepilin-type processing-associated H-X9-DG protein